MKRIEAAILRTVLYGDVFHFPMTVPEIHHFLIDDESASLEAVQDTLMHSEVLPTWLHMERGYVMYGQQPDLIELRLTREAASTKLWPLAQAYGRWLARLPFISMIALTGALAMRNAAAGDDDLDYLVITSPGRVWLARAFTIIMVRLARLRGVMLCPNYLLDESNLMQHDRNSFMAHEIVQMLPLYGEPLYRQMRTENDWTRAYLPNANEPFYPAELYHMGWGWRMVKRLGEFLLSGAIGDRLEHWEYQRKLRRFAPDMQIPHSSARLDETQVKGHFSDHGHPALQRYYEHLRACGLGDVGDGIAENEVDSGVGAVSKTPYNASIRQ
ncbi:MAG: hypothetical protein H6672_18365 [Anaerolineaceae bacterium]|nr:hypothetical protein [Anaerolineaceae bacterium]